MDRRLVLLWISLATLAWAQPKPVLYVRLSD